MNDLYLLVNYLSLNSGFQRLAIGKNTISLDGKVIDFTGFDIKNFLNQSGRLINDMESLSIEDVFNIIKLHVDYSNMLKRFADKQAKEMVDNIINKDSSLKNLHLFNKKDNLGNEMGFLHFVDDRGENHVLSNISDRDFLEAYAFLSQNQSEINPANLYGYLKNNKGKEEIKLEKLEDAEKRQDVSEEHLNNFKELHDYNDRVMENHSPVVGNEEHGIYLNNGQVHTIHVNEKGEKVIERHSQQDGEGKELKDDIVDKSKEEQLISFAEYSAIITGEIDLSPEEITKIRNFENFLFDVITYKDYLTEELYQVYTNFYKFWEYLDNLAETTKTIEEAKERYAGMQERSTQRSTSNARDQVAVLTRKNDNKSSYGYVSAVLYVGLIILVGVVIAVITILAK